MAEIYREAFSLALETTRGTAIANPTHIIGAEAVLTPMWTEISPEEQRGTLAAGYRSTPVREWGEFEGEGSLDTYSLPVLLNMAVAPVTSPTTPTDAVLTRLWTFTRSLTSDNIKSATVWWGDPDVQVLRSVFAMLTELGIQAEANSEDEAKFTFSGQAHYPTVVADPTMPAQLVSPLVAPGRMQVWIDVASGIGTTEIEGRALGGDVTIQTGFTPKWVGNGPAGNLNFGLVGRQRSRLEANLSFEMPDTDELTQVLAHDVLKIKWRLNGPLIETETATDFFHFVEFEFYAPARSLSWGDNEGTNRTLELEFASQVDATAGVDYIVRVQNDRATL